MNVWDNEGVRYAKPKLKVMGLEMIKSSTPEIIREKMKECIDIIMTSTETALQNEVESFKKKFKELPPEEVSFPRGVNGMTEYKDPANIYKKGTPIHVKGALIYNHLIKKLGLEKKYQKIQDGDKLKFTYLKMPNPVSDTVISYPMVLPEEFNLHKYVDYDMQFEKTFVEPVQIVINSIGWKAERQDDLTSFFT